MPDHAGHRKRHLDLAGYVLGTLEPAESASFSLHCGSCDRCRAEVAELDWLPGRLGALDPVAEVPVTLWPQTLAAVDRNAGGRRAPGVAGTPARRRQRWPLAAAAAAMASAAAIASLVAAPSADTRAPRTIDLVAVDDADGRGVTRLQRGPLGIAVRLQVHDLAPPPPSSFYECWHLAASDTGANPARVSAGTFRTTASGRALVQMVTAADPSRYPGIEVTLEPDDGNPAHTGPVVLRSDRR